MTKSSDGHDGVSLHGLDPEEALRALLAVDPVDDADDDDPDRHEGGVIDHDAGG